MASQTFPDLPIQIIPNGVDLHHFTNGNARTPAKEVRILFVSRLIRRKGLQFLIDAMAEVRTHVTSPLVVHVIGDGPDKELFVKQIEALGLSDMFRFYGYVHHEQLPEYYLDADLFVLPSLAEGMPNVVLEAMGSGLPIVATQVPGSEELVHDGENGFLVKPGDAEVLGRALITVMTDEALRHNMGEQSQQIARGYTWQLVTEQYISFYAQMVREPYGLPELQSTPR
jgi:glycosyltransferase involved in cell wall biosynthesis